MSRGSSRSHIRPPSLKLRRAGRLSRLVRRSFSEGGGQSEQTRWVCERWL